uniref:Uncharacterized protein n=1 Tax=Tanacetum cinerariifolium TaxID=118510 RepID=A0A699GPT7_TANCI|nr:hypothetical protein [Tanacetum cinerariifolium]
MAYLLWAWVWVISVGQVYDPRYVVPTGRVIIPTGRYVVFIGRVIVATGRTGRDHDERVIILPPTTVEEHIAVQRESKARTTLLQSITDDHVANFHYMDDARDIWNAVKARFGGNVESKKMRKSMVKQEFSEFRICEAEGLHKGYDRMQKILSQLNQLKAKPDAEDINLNTFSSSQSAGLSHPAFVSATSTSKKMSYGDSLNYSSITTYSVPSNSKTGSHRSGNVIEDVLQSFVIDTEPEQQLAYKDLEQIEKLDLEEMDLKWKMAMLSVKVRCYKCQQKGHFARECRAKGGNDKQRYSSFKIKEIGNKEEDSKALITVDTLVDWTNHDSESDGVIAAKEFGMIAGCDSEDTIKEGAAKLYNLITRANSEEANTAGDAGEFALMGITSERNSSKNLFRLIDSSMSVRTKVGLGFTNCISENELGWDDSAFSVFTTNSKDVEGRPIFHRFAKTDSMKAVPPPLSGDYTSLSDHIDLDESQMSYGPKSLTSCDSKSVSNDFVFCDDSDKSSEVNTNDFASSDSSVKSLEHKPNDSTSCASTSSVSTSEKEAKIESNVRTPIKEPIIVQDLPSFTCNSSDMNEHTSRTSCNKNGYFNKKACHFRKHASSVSKLCFVCRSGTHLIKDCDFYKKQMENKTVGIGVGPVYNKNKVNYQNQFVPQVVLLRTGNVHNPLVRPQPVPTGKPKVTPVPTGKPKVTLVPTGKPQVTPVPTGKPKVSTPIPTGRPNRPSPFPTDRGFSPLVISGWWSTTEDEGIFDSRCSRSMTGNKERLDDFQAFQGGKVTFGGGEGRICNKKNQVLFTDTECLVLSKDFKLPDDSMVVLRVPRKHNVYTINLNNLCPRGNLACLVAHASFDEFVKWHRRMGHVNYKNMNRLVKGNLVRGLPPKLFKNDHTCVACCKEHKDGTYHILKDFINLVENQLNKKVKAIRCDNGIEFKNAHMIDLCGSKGIKREYSNPRTPQQNGVAERKNKTLIEAAKTMFADFKVYNVPNKRVEESMNLRFLEEKPNVHGLGHEWYFDLDYLTDSLGYKHVHANQSAGTQGAITNFAGTQAVDSDSDCDEQVIISANEIFQKELARLKDQEHRVTSDAESLGLGFPNNNEELQTQTSAQTVPPGCLPVPTGKVLVPTGSLPVPTGSILIPAAATKISTDDVLVHTSRSTDSMFDDEPTTRFSCPSDLGNHAPLPGIFSFSSYDDEFGAPLNNVASTVEVSLVATKRINTIHPQSLIIRDPTSAVQTRSKMDVKSAFLYVRIDEEVYVTQPKGFVDPQCLKKVYKVVKALYGLHQALRAWYATLSTFLLKHGYRRGTIDKTLFLKKNNRDIILVQVYVDDIIFRSIKNAWCDEFEALMKGEFQMSAMGELTFFLGSVRTATTPYEATKPKSKNESDSPVNVYLCRSMIEAVKNIFKYLKGQPKLGLWYLKESPLVLEAYSDSDYVRANKDRKSTTGGCTLDTKSVVRLWVNVQRQPTSDPIVSVLEHGQSFDPNTASFSRSHETNAGPFTPVDDVPIRGDFHTSPPRSFQAPPAGQPSGSAEDPITLTALSSVVSTLVQKVHSLKSELKDHKRLFKDVVGKLVKKVKALEVKLKTKKRKLAVSDSDQEDDGTQDMDLDALRALANASMTVDSNIPSDGTSHIPVVSLSGTIVVPPGPSDVLLGTSNVSTAASTVPAGSPNVPTDVPFSAAPAGVSSKGKSLMEEEDIHVKARTFKQMEKDRLGEEVAKRLHDEEMAHMERERAEVQRKRQQDVLDSAMYYNESDWLNIRAQVEANDSLFKTLLGDDMSEDNFPARMAALIKKKRQALAEQLFKERQHRPMTQAQQKAYMRQYIRKVQSKSQIQAFSRTLKRSGPVLEEPSSKRQQSTDAPSLSVPEVPHSTAVSSPPSSHTRRKSLGRKHMHKPKSTLPKLDLDAPAQTFIKVVVNEDSDDENSDDEIWSAVVGWEVLPTPLGEINALYRIDGSTKHFTTLRQILHIVDRQDLVKLYGLVVLSMFTDVSYPLSVKLLERMLMHKLEIDSDVVGNDMTTVEQLIQFIKNQLAAAQASSA